MRKTLTMLALGCAVAATGCATAPSSLDRGIAHYRAGQYFFAADDFNEAIRERPNNVNGYVNRGITRVRLGELNAAIEDYNRAVQLAPGDPEIYFARGNALVAAGQYGPATDDFTRAIELSPQFAKAWFNRGTARSMAGQRDAAMKDWLHAVDVETDPWARSAMRRSAGLEAAPAVTAAGPPVGQPTTVGTVAPAPPPGMGSNTVPLPPPATLAATPPPSPAAAPPSARMIDARALATRAISRELDGDHDGALADLRSAVTMEPDAARREHLQGLIRLLESPR